MDSTGSMNMPRRDFLKLTGAAAGFALTPLPVREAAARFVPVDKGAGPDALKRLLARDGRETYRGDELRYIGMPIGGICAGTLYLGGDGRLWLWDVFNEIKEGTVPQRVQYNGGPLTPGGGANYVAPPEQVRPFEQGFAVRIDGTARPLDHTGWADVSFTGEYPIGFVSYRDPASPVTVDLEAFSPFVPLDEEASGHPATIMSYTLKNAGSAPAKVEIGGWMENAAGLHSVNPGDAVWENTWVAGASMLTLSLQENPSKAAIRSQTVFEDFEQEDWAGWTVEGTAFGPGPVEKSKHPPYAQNFGGVGQRAANSYNIRGGEANTVGDAHTGRLLSRTFKIERRYIEFLISGGNHPGEACLNLLVDGRAVRTATGRNSEAFRRVAFDVAEFEGKAGQIEILDRATGFYGQVGVDHIVFTDVRTQKLTEAPDWGGFALAFLEPAPGDRSTPEFARPEGMFGAVRRTADRPTGGISREFTLAPGESRTVSFVVAWHFPNLTVNKLGRVGNHYGSRFKSAAFVIDHLQKNGSELMRRTRLFHEHWYVQSTLPHWVLSRTMANAATLATMTCARFGDGLFYGWEGIGCCEGTCGHVWQYAQSLGRLFPNLERGLRERVDYGTAFHEDTGLIDFRGQYGFGFAVDAQAGYILRTLREHQTSADDGFLRRVWPKTKKAIEYLIRQDNDEDGILEGRQHNTLDVDLYGASSWLSSLYLAALRAGEEMAKEMEDTTFARHCRQIFERGNGRFNELFWNGQYYVQRLVKEENLGGMRIGNGCEVDQVMGQSWAWQVGLGRVTPGKETKEALKALFRNNYLPDIGPYREEHKPGRWYAVPGEAGLLLCTFPMGDKPEILGPNPTWASMYFNECWTGCEYEAAGHMIAEGLVEEGLTVMRAVHDRHHPKRRNPYNEVECSDHYARGMAVHGIYQALLGFEHHGPKGHIGFAPKVTPEKFVACFTAAEGWGTYSQIIDKGTMTIKLDVAEGKLRLKTLALDVPRSVGTRVKVTQRDGNAIPATVERAGERLVVEIPETVLEASKDLVVTLSR